MSKNNEDHRFKKLYTILNSIEKEKNNANNIFKSGDYEKALEAYDRILKIDPDNRSFNSTIHANKALCTLS